jgi:hypothetical protein
MHVTIWLEAAAAGVLLATVAYFMAKLGRSKGSERAGV